VAAADASIAAEFLPPSIALAPVAFSLLGAGIAAVSYGRYAKRLGASQLGPRSAMQGARGPGGVGAYRQAIYIFLNNKWH